MKVVGIIVEYNPFHNGHQYHINEVRKKSNADVLIAVMSSSVTMRGELSIFDKFTKTKQALEASCDLVIELPFALACQNSDLFAKHTVKMLANAKVEEIWIGSESNDPKTFEKAYIEFTKPDVDDKIKGHMKRGLSYKMATNLIYPLQSNDLLGYSYYKAIIHNNLNIKLKTIARVGDDYLNKKASNNGFASAMAIRGNLELLDKYTPEFVSRSKEFILNDEELFKYLKYQIVSKDTEYLEKLFFAEEGLENKLKEIIKYNDLETFVNALTSKRYTSSRIRRFLMYVLFDITKAEMKSILSNDIDFIRVLGFNENGQAYLSAIKNEINIFTNIKSGDNPILDIEMKLSKILDAIYDLKLVEQEQSIIKYSK